jgi:adenosylcobinamide kinase/adenosylcobinamide-phosphate guanylyltransferase
MPFVLVLGGARSGKSTLAFEIAQHSRSAVTLIATAEALDAEMAKRIARHRRQRPAAWTTIEEPVALPEAVRAAAALDIVIVDCLTLWVSNLIEHGQDEERIVTGAADAAKSLAKREAGAVVVSNEVGLGIIPANPLARGYRDTLGRVNAAFAARADRTVLIVAGRIHELSSAEQFIEGIQWHAR